VGLFLHPGEKSFPVTAARHVFEVAAERRAPVVVATGWFALSEPLQVDQAAADVPDIPVVLTNGGQMNISGLSMADAWLALTSHGNLLVMTNGEYRQDFIERLASELGPERVLHASCAPVFDPVFEQRRIRSATITDEARSVVEGDNAARLFASDTQFPSPTPSVAINADPWVWNMDMRGSLPSPITRRSCA
jgi:predicted TIM-barrel fold metal-dependent hydrolase